MARGASEGAAISESGGQRGRTDIGDLRGFDWPPIADGHERSSVQAQSC
jgi:hypothetical protein